MKITAKILRDYQHLQGAQIAELVEIIGYEDTAALINELGGQLIPLNYKYFLRNYPRFKGVIGQDSIDKLAITIGKHGLRSLSVPTARNIKRALQVQIKLQLFDILTLPPNSLPVQEAVNLIATAMQCSSRQVLRDMKRESIDINPLLFDTFDEATDFIDSMTTPQNAGMFYINETENGKYLVSIAAPICPNNT